MTTTPPTRGPRLPPRPIGDWDEEVDNALSLLFVGNSVGSPTGERPARTTSRVLGIYAWHPAFIRGWLPFSNHLRHSTLSNRQRELAIIRTTWLGFGESEWAQHTRISRAAGWLTEDELAAVQAGPDAEIWNASDANLLRAVDEMVSMRDVTDATWEVLASEFDRQQLIDFVFTVGTYDMHCLAFGVLELEMEPGLERFPAEHVRVSRSTSTPI